jgi:GNAT superfamily N-acetyltransferase
MSAEIARAVEENEIAFLLALGRAGGGEERDDRELTWTIGGSPIGYHNCVVRADLQGERADAAILASQKLLRAKGVPGSWHVGPSMRPSDLAARLRAHGFEGGPEPGMAAELDSLAEVERPEGFNVDRIHTPAELDAYAGVLALGFGEGPKEAEWVRAMYGRIGLRDSVPWRHYLGRLDGHPVATASVFLSAGAAGLYFVSTAPGLRRRGIGAAISRAALLGARELGVRIGVLGSSRMGHRMYQRLGFRDVCDIEVLEWSSSVPYLGEHETPDRPRSRARARGRRPTRA